MAKKVVKASKRKAAEEEVQPAVERQVRRRAVAEKEPLHPIEAAFQVRAPGGSITVAITAAAAAIAAASTVGHPACPAHSIPLPSLSATLFATYPGARRGVCVRRWRLRPAGTGRGGDGAAAALPNQCRGQEGEQCTAVASCWQLSGTIPCQCRNEDRQAAGR